MSHSIVAGEFDEMTPQDAGQASGTCQGRKVTKLFLRNPSFGCRYQIGLNLHFVKGVDQHCFVRSGFAYRALADASIMCARLHTVQQKPSPWLLGSHNPIPCRNSEICGFWCLNNHCATLRHQHIAFHRLRITALGPSRYGIGSHPAVIHNPPCRQRSSIAGP